MCRVNVVTADSNARKGTARERRRRADMGPGDVLRALRRLSTDYPKMLRTLPLDGRLVLLDAQCGRSICGNMFYVARELAENPAYAGLELWLSTSHSSHREAAALLSGAGLGGRVKLVLRNSRRYFKLLASAKWLVCDTCFPPEWVKRTGQVVANTWHGTPLKCMGRDIREGFQDIDNPRKNLLAADFLLFPSEYAARVMAGAYMLGEGAGEKEGDTPAAGKRDSNPDPQERAGEGQGEPTAREATGGAGEDVGPTLLFSGYPRNTAFFDAARRERTRAQLGISGTHAIAYLPTHRPPAPDGRQPVDFQHVLAELDACLGAGQVLFTQLHPLAAGQVDFAAFAHVRPFPRDIELYETLAACDALLTDYSSVMFDFAATGRPIALFAFDEAEYFASRGAYLRLDELPFPKAAIAADALAALEAPQPDRAAFLERFCPREGSHAAADLCARVFADTRSPRVIEARLSDMSGQGIAIEVDPPDRSTRAPR